jgi:hypothetical protein
MQFSSLRKISWLMLCKEITAVGYQTHMKHVNTIIFYTVLTMVHYMTSGHNNFFMDFSIICIEI